MTELTEFEKLDPERVDAVSTPANGVGFLLLKAEDDSEVEKFVSAAERRKMAQSGVAMPNGDFPIPDEGHLRSAIGRLAQYKGDKAAAKRHIIKRARALHLVHLLPKDWNVSKGSPPSECLDQTRRGEPEPEGPEPSPEAGDGGEPHDPARALDQPPLDDGEGDTAPDKGLQMGESLGQTHEDVLEQSESHTLKAELDMTGDHAPDEDDKARREAEEQTEELPPAEGMGVKATEKPGSPEWEHHDVALGERAERLVAELAEVVRTFTEREKAEGGASKQMRRVARRIRSLLKKPALLEEVAKTMSATELIKALDELETARRAQKKESAKKMKVKKADNKQEARVAKEAKIAAKAAKQAAKAAEEAKKLRKQMQAVASEDGRRPFVNDLGVTALLRGPEAQTALKAFDDGVEAARERLSKATSDYERQAAKSALEAALKARFQAKMVAADNARSKGVIPPGRFGPNSTDLFGGTTYTIPEDRAIKAI